MTFLLVEQGPITVSDMGWADWLRVGTIIAISVAIFIGLMILIRKLR